jgi:hypothetical protein
MGRPEIKRDDCSTRVVDYAPAESTDRKTQALVARSILASTQQIRFHQVNQAALIANANGARVPDFPMRPIRALVRITHGLASVVMPEDVNRDTYYDDLIDVADHFRPHRERVPEHMGWLARGLARGVS